MKNTVGHAVAMAFLFTLAHANALSNSLTGLILSSQGEELGKFTAQPYELYARKDVGGAGGIYEFVNNTTLQAQGICNFDRGNLPTNTAFVFNRIAINFSLGVANKAGGVDYITKMPAALRNAEFEIKQGGKQVLSMPVASLHNPYTGTNEADQWTELASMCFLSDESDFTWAFKFPTGETITAGDAGSTFPYVEVRLKGHRTIKRAV